MQSWSSSNFVVSLKMYLPVKLFPGLRVFCPALPRLLEPSIQRMELPPGFWGLAFSHQAHDHVYWDLCSFWRLLYEYLPNALSLGGQRAFCIIVGCQHIPPPNRPLGIRIALRNNRQREVLETE